MVLKNIFELNEDKPLFQLRFLKCSQDQKVKVEVEEVEELNFREVKKHLKRGDTVVIKAIHTQKRTKSLSAGERAAELWYFVHV